MRSKLPVAEREAAEKLLLDKSTGLCALCGEPLSGSDLIVPDHRMPESKGGKTTIANLYLAHKSCNSSRQDLPFEIAQPLVAFRVFTEKRKAATFDDVIDRNINSPRQRVKYRIDGDTIVLEFASGAYAAPIATDPATKVRYFFAEVPTNYILNDKEIQPRLIMHSHVRRLAIDFCSRPVHEPSNCRMVDTATGIAELLQFDGQHKTTAQILLSRTTVPMKVYVNPSIAMLQELVIKIQQEIKKQPLTRSDTLAKLGDVIQTSLEAYKEPAGKPRTEKGFIEAQGKESSATMKKLYFEELQRMIFFDPSNRLKDFLFSGRKFQPTTDKVVINKIIRPLVTPQLLTLDMDAAGGRDVEREAILLILNTIVENMLPVNIEDPANELQRLRATNYFYQGAIGWWLGDILIPAIRYTLRRISESKPLFIESNWHEHEDEIIALVEHLCAWDIWSTQKPSHLKALRSNTLESVREEFAEYNERRLIDEAFG